MNKQLISDLKIAEDIIDDNGWIPRENEDKILEVTISGVKAIGWGEGGGSTIISIPEY